MWGEKGENSQLLVSMSRQAIDSAMRILESIPNLIESENYSQAFEKV